jgi:hypothetical protein
MGPDSQIHWGFDEDRNFGADCNRDRDFFDWFVCFGYRQLLAGMFANRTRLRMQLMMGWCNYLQRKWLASIGCLSFRCEAAPRD